VATQQLISIIVPTYNEAENIQPIYRAIKDATASLSQRFELLFVNDGSSDDTSEKLVHLANEDSDVRPIELARNFGKEIALTAGLHSAEGEAAIMLDADLQHPPELIPEFISKWGDGAELVIGVRKDYKTSKVKQLSSSLFYKIIRSTSDTDLVPHATDFRLVDRQVIDAFNQFTEHNRITRGLFDWLGFNRDFVYFDTNPRANGTASYSFGKLVKLALDSLTGHSMFPLRIAGYIGSLIISISVPLGLFIFVNRYIFNNALFGITFSGSAILAVISLFLSGVMLSCLGLIALYIAHIHQEVTNRPLYVIKPNGNGKQSHQKVIKSGV
jgi:glycosyltransferase involved in cell wall biosynthesis